MKNIIWNNRFIAMIFLAVFAFTTVTAQANNADGPVPVELKYIGTLQNKPLFQLSFTGNVAQHDVIIRISDEYGNAIYKENIKAEYFTKKFLLNTDDIGDGVIRFEISCRKSNQTVAYEINRQTRLQQELVISQLK